MYLNRGLMKDTNSMKLIADFAKTISPVKGVVRKYLLCLNLLDIWSIS